MLISNLLGATSFFESILECMEESIQSSKVGLEGNEVFEVPKDYGYWFDDDLESASNCLHESGKLQVSCSKYIEVDEADSYDSQDHVSVDSSHDAEEGEDIVDFEVLSDLLEEGIGIIIGTRVDFMNHRKKGTRKSLVRML
jgi:hypothetical protein